MKGVDRSGQAGRTSDARIQPEVLAALAALGGAGTAGDLMAHLGRPRHEIDTALEAALAGDLLHLRVTDEGQIEYRLVATDLAAHRASRPTSTPGHRFDRKTLHLIRSRQGVLSLAELVEHTGTTVVEADAEMRRLVEAYGGEAYPSLDGHVVYAFPLVMTRTHGPPDLREPRPAWSRLNDPMGSRRWTEGGSWPVRWIRRWAYGRGLLSWSRGLVQRIPLLRIARLRSRRALRRLALGHVFETALAGTGVVSVETTCRYLAARIGGLPVGRRRVERVLRELSAEFHAPVTRAGDELLFGFRNVKRQFLAAEVVRRRLRLGEVVSGTTVFDSGDSREAASQRDLALFDEELSSG